MSDFETVPTLEMRALRLRIENDALRIDHLRELLARVWQDYENGEFTPETLRALMIEMEPPE